MALATYKQAGAGTTIQPAPAVTDPSAAEAVRVSGQAQYAAQQTAAQWGNFAAVSGRLLQDELLKKGAEEGTAAAIKFNESGQVDPKLLEPPLHARILYGPAWERAAISTVGLSITNAAEAKSKEFLTQHPADPGQAQTKYDQWVDGTFKNLPQYVQDKLKPAVMMTRQNMVASASAAKVKSEVDTMFAQSAIGTENLIDMLDKIHRRKAAGQDTTQEEEQAKAKWHEVTRVHDHRGPGGKTTEQLALEYTGHEQRAIARAKAAGLENFIVSAGALDLSVEKTVAEQRKAIVESFGPAYRANAEQEVNRAIARGLDLRKATQQSLITTHEYALANFGNRLEKISMDPALTPEQKEKERLKVQNEAAQYAQTQGMPPPVALRFNTLASQIHAGGITQTLATYANQRMVIDADRGLLGEEGYRSAVNDWQQRLDNYSVRLAPTERNRGLQMIANATEASDHSYGVQAADLIDRRANARTPQEKQVIDDQLRAFDMAPPPITAGRINPGSMPTEVRRKVRNAVQLADIEQRINTNQPIRAAIEQEITNNGMAIENVPKARMMIEGAGLLGTGPGQISKEDAESMFKAGVERYNKFQEAERLILNNQARRHSVNTAAGNTKPGVPVSEKYKATLADPEIQNRYPVLRDYRELKDRNGNVYRADYDYGTEVGRVHASQYYDATGMLPPSYIQSLKNLSADATPAVRQMHLAIAQDHWRKLYDVRVRERPSPKILMENIGLDRERDLTSDGVKQLRKIQGLGSSVNDKDQGQITVSAGPDRQSGGDPIEVRKKLIEAAEIVNMGIQKGLSKGWLARFRDFDADISEAFYGEDYKQLDVWKENQLAAMLSPLLERSGVTLKDITKTGALLWSPEAIMRLVQGAEVKMQGMGDEYRKQYGEGAYRAAIQVAASEMIQDLGMVKETVKGVDKFYIDYKPAFSEFQKATGSDLNAVQYLNFQLYSAYRQNLAVPGSIVTSSVSMRSMTDPTTNERVHALVGIDKSRGNQLVVIKYVNPLDQFDRALIGDVESRVMSDMGTGMFRLLSNIKMGGLAGEHTRDEKLNNALQYLSGQSDVTGDTRAGIQHVLDIYKGLGVDHNITVNEVIEMKTKYGWFLTTYFTPLLRQPRFGELPPSDFAPLPETRPTPAPPDRRTPVPPVQPATAPPTTRATPSPRTPPSPTSLSVPPRSREDSNP